MPTLNGSPLYVCTAATYESTAKPLMYANDNNNTFFMTRDELMKHLHNISVKRPNNYEFPDIDITDALVEENDLTEEDDD